MIFPAEMVSLNTQASKDRATADGGGGSGRGGQKGCLHCLSKLPSLETNPECAPELHKHRRLEVLLRVFTLPQPKRRERLSELGNSFCSLPQAWQWYPATSRRGCQLTRRLPACQALHRGARLPLRVAHAWWPILQMSKQSQVRSPAALKCLSTSTKVPRYSHPLPRGERKPYTTCWTGSPQEWGAVGYRGSLASPRGLPTVKPEFESCFPIAYRIL